MSKPEKTPAPKPAPIETPQPLNVHLALAAVMQDLKAIGKWGENKDQKFSFRGIDDVMAGLHPIFAAHGIIALPDIVESKHTFNAGQTKNGASVHVAEVRVKYTLSGPLGDTVSGSSIGIGFDTSDKAMPKAMTAAYKNWLCQTFVIATYDTEDADSYGPTVNPRAAAQGEDFTTLTDEQIAVRIQALKDDHDAQRIETPAFIAARNALEDEQIRREEIATQAQKAATPAPAPEKPATSRKTKTEAKPEQKAPAQPIPPADDPLPGVESPAPAFANGTWRTVKVGPECPVAAYRGKTLGDLEPNNILALRNGWAGNPKHAASIGVSEPKRVFAKAVLDAYRELFPEPAA
jgi:hypothetical protein